MARSESEPQSPAGRADIYGRRARIGYTSPPLTTEVFPYEFYKIVPAGVTLVVTTLAIVVRSKDEVEHSYEISMKAAREMAAAGVDIVVLGGVPINLSRGDVNAEKMVASLRPSSSVKMTSSASRRRGPPRRWAVARWWWRSPTSRARTNGSQATGPISACEVLGVTAWGSAFNQIGHIPRQAALELGRELMRAHPDAELSCCRRPTGRRRRLIEPLEQEFGVNVMAAQQTIVWDALRRCGVNDRIEGYGRLLREF